MSYFGVLIDKISAYPWVVKVLFYIYSLNSEEIWIIIIITALLFAILVYRLWGATLMWVLMFLYMISYVLYSANIFGYYKDNNKSNEIRMNQIQNEINKTE
ncbi:MAG: hypothetical protein US83_C0006G0031 [Candidatus Falkowbacteria bacterium GW2011_GWC2_38_22]|uniref:Uncharacterized protein n=1 Tax=Candidatus Falkowbacteria bacterium GW2011_GWE1_38_31 TaxID=1618638 RepID=A0A0G0N1Z2_9BACT|nr:MAG: hypothetical protein US73_C0001G0058 [Candidatus Falkowbacteria bacterium GW2011_GWF2_38_1205]KKQ61391.1 MAG: hypothetical protein US83_C0006G0031 [Candidatus Falkowbacteria bacterium GW2011_GWC2_38_22]KKQ64026.1 MAG: hypothetical protein US84_C0002G0058 [Candidatus Falkowbacteria bacterium GW2011_GWF1_38_22]KKQ66626.1 MAG: hypothetical protein US87_C0001G0147 [Candidatus Falkowbacteria bacterium GW2011_GWE2_38_254]KKQ71131.1 MAG: hypothetical protein US91_C0001G0058 [Candidatus Falkowb